MFLPLLFGDGFLIQQLFAPAVDVPQILGPRSVMTPRLRCIPRVESLFDPPRDKSWHGVPVFISRVFFFH